MVKVVYDTNIIISAVIAKGRPYLVLQLAYNNKVGLFISPDLLREYEEVIKRPKFKISETDVSGTLNLIVTTQPLRHKDTKITNNSTRIARMRRIDTDKIYIKKSVRIRQNPCHPRAIPLFSSCLSGFVAE